MPSDDERFMALAMAEADLAQRAGEVPVGCVLVYAGAVIARAHNLRERAQDPTAHAEMIALRAAATRLRTFRLTGVTCYVTLEPCPMCAAAISLARIRRLYFGAYDPKAGGVDHGARVFDHPTCHHRPDVYGGIAESAAGELLKGFFRERR